MTTINDVMAETVVVRVGTGEVASDGKGITQQFGAQPDQFHPEVLRMALQYGVSRLIGVKLNQIEVDGGKKLEAAQKIFAVISKGEFPDLLRGVGRTVKARFSELDEMIIDEGKKALADVIAKLEEEVRVTGSATGKQGRVVAKDWMTLFVAKKPEAGEFFDLEKGAWNDSGLLAWAKEKPSLVELAEKRVEAMKKLDDNDAIDAALDDLF